MPLYKCVHCNYSTKIKGQLARHKNSKKHRNRIIEIGLEPKEQGVMNQNEPAMNQNEPAMNQNEPAINLKFRCEFCNQYFKTNASKRRHELHRCKQNPNFIDNMLQLKNSKIKTLKTENKILEKKNNQLEKDKKELVSTVTTLIEKVGYTNIQNNIILNNYGKEDLSHITDKIKTELLNIPYVAIPKMIEAIHFNDEKPENKNIILPNKNENLVKIYKDNKWVYKNKSDTITDLVDTNYCIIDEHFDKKIETMMGPLAVSSSYANFKRVYEEGDEELISKIKEDCGLILLNNR